MKLNNSNTIVMPSSVATIVFVMISSLVIQTSHSIYTFRLSNSCNPACSGHQTCIKQTRNCSHTTCPAIIYCVNVNHLPRRYRDSINSLMTTPSPRSGCPVRLLYSPCVTQCQHDSSCRSGHLCCYNGCGHVCLPDLREPYRPKAGFCPKRSWNFNPSCESNCSNDFECQGHQKCCRTSCGNRCTDPCFYWLTDSERWHLPPGCRGRKRR